MIMPQKNTQIFYAEKVKIFLRRFFSKILSPDKNAPVSYSALDNPVEVPSQVECYLFCRDNYLQPQDKVLDVGFGLGYGLNIMAAKARYLAGVEIDQRAVRRASEIFKSHPLVKELLPYNGGSLPFTDKTFDVVTCIEVLEHVPDYERLLQEMARLAKRFVFIATPNKRPENTCANGRPKNRHHLREWTKEELDKIFTGLGYKVQWHFLNGPFKGPFVLSEKLTPQTWTLIAVIQLDQRI